MACDSSRAHLLHMPPVAGLPVCSDWTEPSTSRARMVVLGDNQRQFPPNAERTRAIKEECVRRKGRSSAATMSTERSKASILASTAASHSVRACMHSIIQYAES